MTRRETLKREVLDELAAHTPARFMKHLRRWPSGPLSLVHLHVLAVLDEAGSLPMGELAESLDVSQASATGIVDRMEQRGLVQRRRDDEDRRVIRVGQTAAGRELISAIAAQRRVTSPPSSTSSPTTACRLVGSRALRRAGQIHRTSRTEAPR
jgi:DNA-binding MarR family transcriptional regulator